MNISAGSVLLLLLLLLFVYVLVLVRLQLLVLVSIAEAAAAATVVVFISVVGAYRRRRTSLEDGEASEKGNGRHSDSQSVSSY
jgi:cell division protein FtsW (lipid II flippase)